MNRAASGVLVPMVLAASLAFAQPPNIQLSITEPENGTVVPRRQCGSRDLESCGWTPLNVTGTASGLGTYKIVLFVYSPPAGRWFFQGDASIEADGSWAVSDVIVSGGVGVQTDGAPFRFVAIAVSELPPGLSDVLEGEFPPPGTRAQSQVVLVRRED